ncbi:MAG: hypothetical protein IJZ56_03410 [Oscillospiraceae bacterium]|nr:hypothetical protein [Oscillospiraceae bacterium]
MYNDTITLFNRKPGERGQPDTWYPTVIKNVNLNIDRAAILAKYGAESQDNAVLHIRYKKDGDEILVSEKPWMPPKAWDGTEDSITFASGTNFDFFWMGEWNGGVVSDADSRWSTEGFYNYMNRTHDYVFAVSSVAMYTVIPHFEIMGK